jgi:hypothetical protein
MNKCATRINNIYFIYFHIQICEKELKYNIDNMKKGEMNTVNTT